MWKVYAFLAVATLCSFAGCHQRLSREQVEERSPSDPNDVGEVWIVGTPSYDEKVGKLKIKPEDAERLATQFVRTNQEEIDNKARVGGHYVIAKDCYLFTRSKGKDRLVLVGIFVDCTTGDVRRNRVPYILSFHDYPDLGKAVYAGSTTLSNNQAGQ